MEIGNTAVQTLMAIDLAAAEFRHRIAEHVFLNSSQLSPLCHRPLDLHRFMEQFAQLMAQPLGVILVEGDPDRARATVESFLENRAKRRCCVPSPAFGRTARAASRSPILGAR